jgi:hypothetical protein
MVEKLLSAAVQGASSPMQPWVDALPGTVPLPWLHWTAAELAELQDTGAVAEAQHLRGMFDDCCEVSAGGPLEWSAWGATWHGRSQ